MDLILVKHLCEENKIRWTEHIFKRLVERGISMKDVKNAILTGEIIEDYPNDYPFPSCLVLGASQNGTAIHVVCAPDDTGSELWLITAYFPSTDKWVSGFKARKVKELEAK